MNAPICYKILRPEISLFDKHIYSIYDRTLYLQTITKIIDCSRYKLNKRKGIILQNTSKYRPYIGAYFKDATRNRIELLNL